MHFQDVEDQDLVPDVPIDDAVTVAPGRVRTRPRPFDQAAKFRKVRQEPGIRSTSTRSLSVAVGLCSPSYTSSERRLARAWAESPRSATPGEESGHLVGVGFHEGLGLKATDVLHLFGREEV